MIDTPSLPRPLRVHHIITRMIIGGAQENTLYTVEGLHADPRFEVTLVTGPAVGPEGDLLARGRARGLRITVIPAMRRAINPWRDLVTLVRLFRLFVRERPDIVHTHSSKAGILGRLAARLAGVPVVIHTIHGLPFHPYQGRAHNLLFIFLERVCTRLSDKVIVVANAMRDQCLRAHVGTPSRFVHIWSGMETDAFLHPARGRAEMRRRLGLGAGDFVVAKVARLFPLKGHADIVAAGSVLCRLIPDLRFLFIGDGLLQADLKARIHAAGLDDRFVFAGLVPPGEVPDHLAAADMVVHASYREGLARVLPQALLAGLPVVSYAVDGAPEVITDGINGRLVAPGDRAALAAAIAAVHRDHPRYAAAVRAGRAALGREFSVPAMVNNIVFWYLTIPAKRIK